jgi:hypothetical protein
VFQCCLTNSRPSDSDEAYNLLSVLRPEQMKDECWMRKEAWEVGGPVTPDSIRRKSSASQQQFAENNTVIGVDVQYGNGGPAAWREADCDRTVPGKVPQPALAAWIEESYDAPGFRITAT